MKFSVVISVLNTDDVLKNCIKSVYNQLDNKKEFEILLVVPKILEKNNDKLCDIIEEYKNIKVFRLDDNNLNKGKDEAIKYSSGKYIIFINSYEYLDKEALNTYYSHLCSNDLDILDSDYKILLNDVGKKYEEFSRKRYIEQKVFNGNEFYKYVILKDCFNTNLSRYVYKTQFLLDNELFFCEETLDCNYLFITNAIINANKVKYFDFDFIINSNIKEYANFNDASYKFKNIKFLVDNFNSSNNVAFYKEAVKISYDLILFAIENKVFYEYIEEVKNTLKCLNKKLLSINEQCGVDILINNFNLYDKIKKEDVKKLESRYLNNIYVLNNIIKSNKNKTFLDDEICIQIENFFKNYSLYNRFLSYDKIQDLIQKYKNGEEVKLGAVNKYMNSLQNDLYICLDDRIENYISFEEKICEIINNI